MTDTEEGHAKTHASMVLVIWLNENVVLGSGDGSLIRFIRLIRRAA